MPTFVRPNLRFGKWLFFGCLLLIVFASGFLGVQQSQSALSAADEPPEQHTSSLSGVISDSSTQILPKVAYSSAVDEYMIVFEHEYSTSDHDIRAQVMDSAAAPVGGTIAVATTSLYDRNPDIVYNSGADEYLVVWEQDFSSTDHDIFGRRFSSLGVPLSDGFRISGDSRSESKPAIAYNSGLDEYLVVWQLNAGSDEFQQYDIYAQLLYSNGTLKGSPFIVSNSPLNECNADVVYGGYDYMTVWQGKQEGTTEYGIYSQEITSLGNLTGGQHAVITWEGDQVNPRITYNPVFSTYMVIWEDHHFSAPIGWSIYAQQLDTSGYWEGNLIPVAFGGEKNRLIPDVAYNSQTYSYLAFWEYEYGASDHDVYGRRIAFNGSLPEDEFIVSSLSTQELHPTLASGSENLYIVVWEDYRTPDQGGDIYAETHVVEIPTLTGYVFSGDVGDQSAPLAGVAVDLFCSNTEYQLGEGIGEAETNEAGYYALPAYTRCEFYNIWEEDPTDYISVDASTIGGHRISSNWIYYNHPLIGNVLYSNKFWDKPKPPADTQPPGSWQNFTPAGWINDQTANVSVRVEDTYSGLAVSTASFSFSIDGGSTWSIWSTAACTGSDSTTEPQTISAAVPFHQDSLPAGQNQVRFRISDRAGNLGESPAYPVKIDTVAPNNPPYGDCPSHSSSQYISNSYVTCNWGNASDANSGIAGYSIGWTASYESIPDPYQDITEAEVTSGFMEDGLYYFHVRSIDYAGNAAVGAWHYGVIAIDTTPPTAWMTSPAPGAVDESFVTIAWQGYDKDVGVKSYDVQYMLSGGSWTNWAMAVKNTDAVYNGTNGQTISFRVRARDQLDHLGDWSSPLTITFGVPVTVVVKNEAGAVLSGADVYLNGNIQGATNSSGMITIYYALLGDQISARYLIEQHPANKYEHNWIYGPQSWSYRIYITSVNFDNLGIPQVFMVTNTSVQQVLTVRRDNPLIGFYILASVEWDANQAYLDQLSDEFREASAFLLDVTDGQMYFEVVDIWDQKQLWAEADYHIDASNFINPNASVAGIWYADPWHIYFGRYIYAATIIHEFGHYGFDLYDEYKNAQGKSEGAGCTVDVETTPYAEAASIMNKEWIASEMCSSLTIHPHNTNTQQEAERGGPCWDTVYDRYRDKQNPPRWILERPNDRGSIMPGPTSIPVADWYKTRTIGLDSNACDPFNTYWLMPDGSPALDFDMWVKGSHAIWQGITRIDTNLPPAGKIEIFGLYSGDTVEAHKDCGWFCSYSAKMTVYCGTQVADTQSAEAGQPGSVVLQPDPFGLEVSTRFTTPGNILEVTVYSSILLPTPPVAQVMQEGSTVQIPVLSYDGSKYTGTVTLDPDLGLKGHVFISASNAQAETVTTSTAFLAQPLSQEDLTWITSSDGKMEIYLKPGSLPGNPVVSIGSESAPVHVQDGLMVVGNAYRISESGGSNSLSLPGVININFTTLDLGKISASSLGIYKWDYLRQSWILMVSQVDLGSNYASADINDLGLYALLGKPELNLFLPLIMR